MPSEVGLTILLVDDEPLILRSMAQALRHEGYEALAAPSAMEALALGPGDHIDLLITDILMPKMSGHTLAKELRKRQPRLAVLFVSGSPVEPSDLEAHGCTGDAVLLKPFGLADLLREVRKLVGPPTASPPLPPLATPASEQNLRSR